MSDTRNWFEPVLPSRKRQLLAGRRDGLFIEIEGKRVLNFSSNDYLGLSNHPDVSRAVQSHVKQYGLGSGASRYVSGDSPEMHLLEQELAEWKGYEACLLLGSGMLANIGLLQALAGRQTELFTDKLNHASLVDGARLSAAKVKRFTHLDMHGLEKMLAASKTTRKVIVSDGVFSMDGDTADVNRLLQLAEAYDALLVVDDAHGVGTIGKSGKGLINEVGVQGHARLIEVGTLGKAFGAYGAYILSTHEMIEGLRQQMRTAIYSTALPPSIYAGARVALKLIQQGGLVAKLQSNIRFLVNHAKSLRLMESSTAIQPVLLGSDEAALSAAMRLRESGYFVPAIRPPTVPEGTSRLRITLSAFHSEQDIDSLIQAVTTLG